MSLLRTCVVAGVLVVGGCTEIGDDAFPKVEPIDAAVADAAVTDAAVSADAGNDAGSPDAAPDAAVDAAIDAAIDGEISATMTAMPAVGDIERARRAGAR